MNAATPIPSIFDTQSLSGLKNGLKKDDPQALKAAAQQFEAVLLQTMLKSMRAASPQDSMFESDQTRFYQEMLDSQLAQVMAAKGGTGLAAVIERQLSAHNATSAAPEHAAGFPLLPTEKTIPLAPRTRSLPLPTETRDVPLPLQGSPLHPGLSGVTSSSDAARTFATAAWPHALAASQTTGVPPQFLLAHAALESGWGRSEPRTTDGRPSHNLFGIKAGSSWQGATVEAVTTEYINGVAEKRIERFRAYGSYAEGFEDYARLLSQSPRYAAVMGSREASQFAQGLQQAGYATDPAYANKLLRVIGSLGQKLSG